jgi:CheY-like chemotaxis protein
MKDEFLATLSHELRTPLQAMLGWLHILRQETLEPADSRRGLEAIERNARLQAQLIEDLLDMSRIESGKVRLDMQDVDLALVIESALAAAAPAADARGLVLERRIDPSVGLVRGDAARLQQVLWNLISNALKFTPRGGRVTVALRQSPAHVELSVTDTGIGINPEFLAHVFDRFRQADPSTTRQHGGLGLGLSIARHLTELHGGTLEAVSDGPDRGATFTVRLPQSATLAVDPAKPLRPIRLDADDGAAADSLAGTRVLVVDDREDARELIARLLADREATVTAVPGVDEAIECLTRGTFDVLVSDISMPGRDGYELIRHVRAHVGALPALALTALAREEDEQRALAAGYDRHLAKPISPERLVAVVAGLRPGRRESSVA